jgi:shikimate dehydrogenase
MKRYYLIGGSVGGSPSPAMMNSAFRGLGIDASYEAVSVSVSDFQSRFNALSEEASGINVTIPFKAAVAPLLEDLDAISRRIGAVNVVKIAEGRRHGYNTDVSGVVVPLRENSESRIKAALLVGAGGAAKAFCDAMSQMGCEAIQVAVRNIEKGRRFVEEVSEIFPKIAFSACEIKNLAGTGNQPRFNLVFNATPMGSDGIPLSHELMTVITGDEIVFDAVYRPVETELLKSAKERGCRVIHGYEMLLNQGTAAFEIWTGVGAPRDAMRGALLTALEAGTS